MGEMEKLIRSLKSGHAFNRMQAAMELGRIGDPSAIPALAEALCDPSAGVRFSAITAMRKINHPSSIPALLKALERRDAIIRLHSLKILDELGDISVIPAIAKTLGDAHPAVREHAEKALEAKSWYHKTMENLESVRRMRDIKSYEKRLSEAFAIIRRQHPDQAELVEIKMQIAKLMQYLSSRKNQLKSKRGRDILLPDKPRRPKRGRIFQAARRVRNG